MNRRSFLKKIGIGAATIALAPTVLEKVVEPEVINAKLGEYTTRYSVSTPEINAALAQYSDWANFSDFVPDALIDEEIVKVSEILAEAHSRRIQRLCEGFFDEPIQVNYSS